jgi:hypothetical protein
MIVLREMRVADSSVRSAAKWLAGQVETGGSGLARDRFNIKRDGGLVNEIIGMDGCNNGLLCWFTGCDRERAIERGL